MRLNKLDALRGLNLISMIFFHGMWDLVYIFGKDFPWYRGIPGYIWQQSICCLFILLSGFSWNLGHRHIKRGLTVFLAGAIVTLATVFLMPENAVWFGILTFMGSAMLLMIPLNKLLKPKSRPGALVLFLLSFVLFRFTRYISNGILGFTILYPALHLEKLFIRLPESLYVNLLTAFLGLPPADFTSTDYFSLFPWIFLYITGYGLYHLLPLIDKNSALSRFLEKSICPPLEFIGRHTLIIYMLHQPVIYGLLILFFSVKR